VRSRNVEKAGEGCGEGGVESIRAARFLMHGEGQVCWLVLAR